VVSTDFAEPAGVAALKPWNEARAAQHDLHDLHSLRAVPSWRGEYDRETSAAFPVQPKCWPATRRPPVDRRAPRHTARNSGCFA
jgi:hypothetical protein